MRGLFVAPLGFLGLSGVLMVVVDTMQSRSRSSSLVALVSSVGVLIAGGLVAVAVLASVSVVGVVGADCGVPEGGRSVVGPWARAREKFSGPGGRGFDRFEAISAVAQRFAPWCNLYALIALEKRFQMM
jgi:hypothetical protein